MQKNAKKQSPKVARMVETPKSNASFYAATLARQVEAGLGSHRKAPTTGKKKVR